MLEFWIIVNFESMIPTQLHVCNKADFVLNTKGYTEWHMKDSRWLMFGFTVSETALFDLT